MGKSTIPMAIFNSKLLVYQRVNHEKNQSALERLIFDDLFLVANPQRHHYHNLRQNKKTNPQPVPYLKSTTV